MIGRTAAWAVYFSLALSGAIAQTNDTAKPAPEPEKPASNEVAPDLKAFRVANLIRNPEKKIDALEKWKREFPESQMQHGADSTILSTLIKKLPQQTSRIRQFAAAALRRAKDKSDMAHDVADELLAANLLLKDAERYAKKSVDAMRFDAFRREQIAGAQKRGETPPPASELEKRFQQRRAPLVATLGLIELKLGHNAKAKTALETSYAGDPKSGTVLSALGEMAFHAGDESKAGEYFLSARLSGRASKEARADFDTIYKKQHNGSLEGLEAMLDTEYRKRYPNPVKIEAYRPGGKRSDRVVLAEVFTGSGCPPCAGADVAFDAAMERYTHKDFSVLMYHLHIPRPDPMTNPDTNARAYGSYKVNSVPTFIIDGIKAGGGGSRERSPEIYKRFNKQVEEDLESPAEAQLTGSASLHDDTVRVHASVQGVTGEWTNLKLQIALIEKELRYTGENGIRFHPMVVRALRSMDLKGEDFEQEFNLNDVSQAIQAHLDDYEKKGHRGDPFQFAEKKSRIDRKGLAVVIFVQDDKTKHVLQAAYVDMLPENATVTGGSAEE